MYRWVEHTGELELEIDSPSERDVFADALFALAELLTSEDAEPGPRAAGGEPATRTIRLEAPDRARLLAAWLSELAFLAETDGLVPERLTRLQLGGGELRAEVLGHLDAPPHLVKAVTYHRLQFERAGTRWRARAVMDV